MTDCSLELPIGGYFGSIIASSEQLTSQLVVVDSPWGTFGHRRLHIFVVAPQAGFFFLSQYLCGTILLTLQYSMMCDWRVKEQGQGRFIDLAARWWCEGGLAEHRGVGESFATECKELEGMVNT